MQDRGSYLLILEIDNGMVLDIGSLGRFTFQKGYYLYVGSAMKNLGVRIRRHLRKTKKQHWHIDYLTAHAGTIIPLPVRSSQRDECEIAKALSSIMKPGPLASDLPIVAAGPTCSSRRRIPFIARHSMRSSRASGCGIPHDSKPPAIPSGSTLCMKAIKEQEERS
jgi:Uri superfamily endonuclease